MNIFVNIAFCCRGNQSNSEVWTKMICLVEDYSRNIFVWRVERVIILFCYFICNSSIYILVFNILLSLFLFYLSNFTTVILDSSIIILPF